ncbi:dTDP-4-amino-4,6-dideoxygalactose transaminase [Paenibacillus intestini]|nr:dTDP-4-amino-4,6-dideoxygalactose transaminase [Paenibacillus intestini]
MGVLFSAPQYEFQLIRQEWEQRFNELCAHGVFVGGAPVKEFEKHFASFLDVKGVAGVGNGTDALFLALKALGIGKGDEVITATNTFIATVEAIHHTGATPVLVDCERDSYLIDLDQVKANVTSRTKAIIPVHLYGQMVDIDEFVQWAADKGIFIVEDCAQAAGAHLNGKYAGSIGSIGCFSFYPDKNLGAIGDGGAISSNHPELLSGFRKLRNHGGELKYIHEFPGFNSRLDPLQALVLDLKLKYLNEWSERRRENAGIYSENLSNVEGVIVPKHRGNESHVFHLYVIRVEEDRRDALKKHLQKKGILTAIQYPTAVHQTPAFQHLGYGRGAFPVSEEYAQQILSLPMSIALSKADIEYVCDEIRSYMGTN